MSLTAETTGYIYNEVLRRTRYLVITVNGDGLVADFECPGDDWTVPGLRCGERLPATLLAIMDAAAGAGGPQLFPYVNLHDSTIVDVHVLTSGDRHQVILQDVTDIHDTELRLQQKAHEVSLLLERQEQLNRQLARSRAEAERASQAKSRFIASMSHEFRTPLNSMMGHVELLLRENPDSSMLQAVQRASWHLLTLVENLLEQARQGEGIMEIDRAPVDVDSVLQDMRGLFALHARSKGLDLQITGPSGPVQLETDGLRLRQVLINLLGNALRYTRTGRVELLCEADDDSLEFSVRDTGPGISAADRERIFEPFTRLDSSGITGAGLGLTIARQLVEAMGGGLEVSSTPGEGSTFSFRLPCTRVERAEPESDLAGLRILLVDDDEDIRALYGVLLADWGIEVRSAAGYREALEELGNHSFDLVIADQQLQDGRGSDLLSRVAVHASDCGRILCSGSGETLIRQSGARGLVDAVLLKPVQPERLRGVISRVAAGRTR